MSAIDSPLLVDALRTSLLQVLDLEPFEDDWGALVKCAGERCGWSEARIWTVIEREPEALFALAVELNELRSLAGLADPSSRVDTFDQ